MTSIDLGQWTRPTINNVGLPSSNECEGAGRVGFGGVGLRQTMVEVVGVEPGLFWGR